MKTCTMCGETKELSCFYKLYKGHRPNCKDCSEARVDKYKKFLKMTADHILKRINETDNPRNKSYKGIECRIGKTKQEIREYIHQNFEQEIRNLMAQGKVPSLDRIDPSGHYEHGNLRIITAEENARLGREKAVELTSHPIIAILNGVEMKFPSVKNASEELGIQRTTILRKLKNGTSIGGNALKRKDLKGMVFKYD